MHSRFFVVPYLYTYSILVVAESMTSLGAESARPGGETARESPSILDEQYTPRGLAAVEGWVAPELAQVMKLFTTSRRLFEEPTPAEVADQKAKPSHYQSLLHLQPFAPADEAAFEDWCDDLAGKVKKLRLCADVVFDAWKAACGPRSLDVAREFEPQSTTEGLLDMVARRVFKRSTYHWVVLEEITSVKPMSRVMAAEAWLTSRVRRYLRLIRRRSVACALTDQWLMRAAYRSLPRSVATQISLWTDTKELEEFYDKAGHLSPP